MARAPIAGPDSPEAPFPVVVRTQITGGFGRGSSELGIPTANIPPGELAQLDPGVYFGWARVARAAAGAAEPELKTVGTREIEFNYGRQLARADEAVHAMVMSIGWNPFFKNEQKSAEVHILHAFPGQFYGADISVVVAGFIRAEQSYDSLDALVADIRCDMDVARRSLERPRYAELKRLIEDAPKPAGSKNESI